MTDIALTIDTTGALPVFDFAMSGGDLATDEGLKTAIIVSLFCDRRAVADDSIPDGGVDRRGWWGDAPVSGEQPDYIGSRLWLLERAKATTQTATLARHYIAEALQWLIDDGVAARIDVETKWLAPGFLGIGIGVVRTAPDGKPDPRYDLIWKATVS